MRYLFVVRSGYFQRACIFLISVILVAFSACGQGSSANRPQVVSLQYVNPKEYDVSEATYLEREFVRQSIFIAAREGLGILTRDMALREDVNLEDRPIDIDVRSIWKQPCEVTLVRLNEDGSQYKWHTKIDEIEGVTPGVRSLLEQCEFYSRGLWVDKLKEMGFEGQPVKVNADARVPDRVLENLQQMNMIAQFAAVREIHQAIRSEGQSPALLAALVRGYANLGQLTKPLMNASHKVFLARSVLYARRLMVLDDASPQARVHMAYAWAMAGWHARARGALDGLDKLPSEAFMRGDADFGVSIDFIEQLLALYLDFDTEGVLQLAGRSDPRRPLVEFLAFLTVQYRGSEVMKIEIGKRVLFSQNSTCYRVLDELNQAGGIRYLHDTTEWGTPIMKRMFDKHLPNVEQLPAQAAEQLSVMDKDTRKQHVRAAKIAEALSNAGQVGNDEADISWQVLGRMIEELNFSIIWRRTHFMGVQWGVEVDDYLDNLYDTAEAHPYSPMLKMYYLNSGRDSQQYYRLVKDVEFIDPTFANHQMMMHGWDFGNEGRNPCRISFENVFMLMDWVADDLVKGIRYTWNNEGKVHYAQALISINSQCPAAVAALIQYDTGKERSNFAEYETRFKDHPAVLRALAKVYMKEELLDNARRCLEKHLTTEVDRWTYETLADVYLKQGDELKWRRTLDNYLVISEDYGLDHANIRNKISNYYIKIGDYQTALPYAEAAAGSYASWAMDGAIKCNEALKRYDRAERWSKAQAERYDSQSMDWYFWCVRTGHGDIEAAKRHASQFIDSIAHRASRYDRMHMGIYEMLHDNNAKAFELFKEAHIELPRPYSGTHLYLLAMEFEDSAQMDLAVQSSNHHVRTNSRWESHKITIQLLNLFDETVSMNVSLDLKKADGIIAQMDDPEQMKSHCFVARFLQLRGDEQTAVKYYKRAAASTEVQEWDCTLANVRLRKMGIEPPQFYDQQVRMQRKPAQQDYVRPKRTPPAPR